MKNLQSFGVQELNTKEIRETNGGADLGLGAFLVITAFAIGWNIGQWVRSLF
tara:strand:- start:13 stop:168 length:156 start_codon:yes stop_codon:yes gene_type:complete